MTSRFSKLKCDLHGKYQAPLEPHLKKCKEKTRTKTKSNIWPHISERLSLIFISSKSRKQGA